MFSDDVWRYLPLGPVPSLVMVGVGTVGSPAAVLLSTSVEVWQMAAGSVGDIDDIVLNSIGGVLGAAVATRLSSLRPESPGS